MNPIQTASLKSLQLPTPFSGSNISHQKPAGSCTRGREAVSTSSSVFAVKRDAGRDKGHNHHYQKGSLVDENMIVLRMRIQEMKMAEGTHGSGRTLPPEDWMEWEKKWYSGYNSDVYEAVGLLQNLLMESRPSLVLGMVALMIISGTTSMALLIYYFVHIFNGLIHLL